jgi:hypothetical protein
VIDVGLQLPVQKQMERSVVLSRCQQDFAALKRPDLALRRKSLQGRGRDALEHGMALDQGQIAGRP